MVFGVRRRGRTSGVSAADTREGAGVDDTMTPMRDTRQGLLPIMGTNTGATRSIRATDDDDEL